MDTYEIISIDFSCVNCEKMFSTSKARLYCSMRCQEDAKLIRYVRNAIKKGTFQQPDVQDAIEIRLAHACSKIGYYDSESRKISSEKRQLIFERDKGLCNICGNPGNEIDHINGNSSEMDNLQLLCNKCHIKKTQSGLTRITTSHPRYEEITERRRLLLSRIHETQPERICDNPETWRTLQSKIMSDQRQLLRQIKDDIEGISKNRDPFEEERVAQELDELDELRAGIEALELQKQSQIDQILTPEILAKVEQIRIEFSNKIQILNESIQPLEQRIKESVKKYGSTIKGGNFQAVFRKGATIWDNKSLEEYSKTHPEILQFRKEGKGSIAIVKIKKVK